MSLISADALPAEPLDALRKVSQSELELDELRWTLIAAARDAGASWADIGEALAISRQSAWEYFTRRASAKIAKNVAANADLSEGEALDLAVEEVREVRRSRRSH
jgi:cyanate lyase